MARILTPVRRAIFESGLTQREIADRAGLSESRFSLIANGLHPDSPTRQRIAEALGRTESELWPGLDIAA
jgi:transcriptional regulator with XRE-family HTH domain